MNGNPAEMVKLRYVDKATGHAWTEELVFIEGPDSAIYSVALKCATPALLRMEPLFARIVDSWNVPQASLGPSIHSTQSIITRADLAPNRNHCPDEDRLPRRNPQRQDARTGSDDGRLA